ncbi:hypothetical protein BZL30_4196 [Mycobacterium kansasii]|uniref:Uncharacterized protein n=1 Tax=Mycobacterium kansasii TaxID=1768 RepID=A0A1V3X9M7_MYCKA|nr:hypothetical protein BZL30_4196 [Mycobacterium kansasii]
MRRRVSSPLEPTGRPSCARVMVSVFLTGMVARPGGRHGSTRSNIFD